MTIVQVSILIYSRAVRLRCVTVKSLSKRTDCLSISQLNCTFLLQIEIFGEAAGPGFEPGLSDSESLVLPLHHPAKIQRGVL